MQRSRDVDVEELRGRRRVRFDQRHEREMRRVVDENVGGAEALDRGRDNPLAVGRDADIGPNGENRTAISSISAAERASVSCVRPAMATFVPARAKARAIAKPIPAPPPVTIAVWPEKPDFSVIWTVLGARLSARPIQDGREAGCVRLAASQRQSPSDSLGGEGAGSRRTHVVCSKLDEFSVYGLKNGVEIAVPVIVPEPQAP